METRTTARNGRKLTGVFLLKLDTALKRGHDGYGQLRYTHSASPYRSIATGGSHFLANGCFHPLSAAPCFPLTVSFAPCCYSRHPFLLFTLPRLSPSLSLLSMHDNLCRSPELVRCCFSPRKSDLRDLSARFLGLAEKFVCFLVFVPFELDLLPGSVRCKGNSR